MWQDHLPRDPSHVYDLLVLHLPMAIRSRPDWLREQQNFDAEAVPGEDGVQLVLQRERPDGAELLTVRFPLQAGPLDAYAGLGLNRAVYFAEADGAPTPLSRQKRHRSLGVAAELGAVLRLSEHASLGADLRWIEIDGDADLLRSEDGLVAADRLSFGVSLRLRCR